MLSPDLEHKVRVEEFLRRARIEGWTATVRNGGHIELTHPLASEPVFMAATPSDHRWHLNVTAWMRRVLPPEPRAKAPERPAERPKRRPRPAHRPAPARAYPEGPLAMYRLPEPERREYPPEPTPRRRIAGGPAGFRSCLDRV